MKDKPVKKRIRWTREKAIAYFKEEIVPNVKPLTIGNICLYSHKFYIFMQRSRIITWSELYTCIGLDFEEIHKHQRHIGQEKYWTREKLIKYFKDEILPNNEGLKRRDLTKKHRPFCRGMDNSKEITWSELYAVFNLDYEEIKRQPSYWNRERLIEYMMNLIKMGEPVNITALSDNHEPFYKALIRSKEITVEELCNVCGLDYKLVRREKRYQTDDDARTGLIKLSSKGIPLHKAKMVRKDTALYKYLLERGNGSLQRGIQLVGFNVTKEMDVPAVRINDLRYAQLLGHYFEKVLAEIFEILRLGIQGNNELVNHCRPDFISKKDGTWYDAKLSTRGVFEHIQEGVYVKEAKKIIYVYLLCTKETNVEIPENVKIIHVDEFVNKIKSSTKRENILGKLLMIKDLYKHLMINNQQKKS